MIHIDYDKNVISFSGKTETLVGEFGVIEKNIYETMLNDGLTKSQARGMLECMVEMSISAYEKELEEEKDKALKKLDSYLEELRKRHCKN